MPIRHFQAEKASLNKKEETAGLRRTSSPVDDGSIRYEMVVIGIKTPQSEI
jgi:hypothetical protein